MCLSFQLLRSINRRTVIQANPGFNMRPYKPLSSTPVTLKKKKKKKPRGQGMAQVVEHWPSMLQALGSIPRIVINKRQPLHKS
jgi:hypothetical protein